MYKKLLFAAALPVIISIIILVVRSPLRSAIHQSSLPDQDAQMERAARPVNTPALTFTTEEPMLDQPSSSADGATLVARYCTRCHPAQSLVQVKGSRADWDKTLAKMESMGIRIDASDRSALLDYLAATYQP